MQSFLAAATAACLLALIGTSVADGQTTLPPVQVVGHPCTYPVTCIYPSGFGDFLVSTPLARPPMAASLPPGPDGAPIATCKSLRDGARQLGCDVNNPPPAPGFPSPTRGDWASNGCGDGSLGATLGQAALGAMVDGYTGDPTKPLPGVSFAVACGNHDSCYYYASSKGLCDVAFAKQMDSTCHNTPASSFAGCLLFAGAYGVAVQQHGQHAFDEDHRSMTCAKIAKDLRNGNCVAS